MHVNELGPIRENWWFGNNWFLLWPGGIIVADVCAMFAAVVMFGGVIVSLVVVIICWIVADAQLSRLVLIDCWMLLSQLLLFFSVFVFVGVVMVNAAVVAIFAAYAINVYF